VGRRSYHRSNRPTPWCALVQVGQDALTPHVGEAHQLVFDLLVPARLEERRAQVSELECGARVDLPLLLRIAERGWSVPIRNPNQAYQVWADAFNSGDIEALKSLYTPDAIFMAEPGRQVQGREAIGATYEKFVSMKVPITLEMFDVAVADDIAQTRGRWTMRGTSADGQPVDSGGTLAEVWKRQPDGNWLLMIDSAW
jgi:uncharacterized protein (TIGR02246 family)